MPTHSVYYPWQRHWLTVTSDSALPKHPYNLDATGYVIGSEMGPGFEMRPKGVTLAQLGQDLKCAVLLGEPGIGKSHEWKKQQVALMGLSEHLFLDLGTFSTEESLRYELENSPQVEKWKSNDSVLTLWFDSLDEGMLHINKLQASILRVLKRLDYQRLRLRITCRNAIWPIDFSEALQELWGLPKNLSSPEFAVLLLSPLTQQQVKEAAEQEGFDTDQFLSAIAEVDAQPLASSPVTLQLLINLYRVNKPTFGISEAAGRAGLYERGCLALCEMPDRDRNEQHRVNSRTRLLLAGYLAFLAVLTNRRQIHIEPVTGTIGPNELDPYSVGAGQTVEWERLRAPINESAIRDLLRNTGLFTDVANGRMVWTHQSYAEFLAAWYLKLSGLPSSSLRSLFRSAADPSGGIVPALQETAAWLAELQPTFWYEVLELDPIALTQSDLRRLNSSQRDALVARLITWLSSLAYIPYRESSERNFLQHLSHPKLAEQLLPILTNPETPGQTQRFATDMALACQVKELVPSLVTQALDIKLPFSTRSISLSILVYLADDSAREALRPLCMQIPKEDDSDEFRGDLLRILWPSHLSLSELFPLLTHEKQDHILGSYRVFLYQLEKTEVQFSLDSILAGLQWLIQSLPALDYQYSHEEFWKKINLLVWRQAWHFVNDSRVMDAVTELFIIADQHFQPFSVEEASDKARISLFERLLHRRDRPNAHSLYNIHNQEPLLKQEDWDRIYKLLYNPLTAVEREWLTQVLMFLLARTPIDNNTTVYGARYDQLHEVKCKFASSRRVVTLWCKAVNLNSKEAIRNRQNYLRNSQNKREKIFERKKRRRLILHKTVNIKRHIQQILAKGNTSTFHEWHILLHYISPEKNITKYFDHNDISQSRRWAKLSVMQQTQIVNLACNIVSRYPIPPKQSYSLGGGVNNFAISLYRALLLCHSQRSSYMQSLPENFWENWAIFLLHIESVLDNKKQYELTKLAAITTPAAVDTALILQADAYDNIQNGSLYCHFKDWYQVLPQGKFTNYMLLAIELNVWREDFNASLLIDMLDAGYKPALDYAMELIPETLNHASQKLVRRGLAVAVYKWLLFSNNSSYPDSWMYWERLSTQPDIAATVIKEHINHPMRRDLQYLTVLDEEKLYVIILWLTYAFQLTPEDIDDWEDSNPKGSYAALRTAAVSELAARGTTSAWEMLKQLSIQMGEPYWLRIRLDRVRENLRRNSWEPITPDGLIALSLNASRRWVKSAKDLQELILESLSRFQADLHNELVAAEVLWVPIKDAADRRKTVGYEVRDENFLSDVIRRHFVQDLQRTDILVKREVEIRPSFGADTGQRTDIYVEAFYRDAIGNKTDVVTVVIEVKLSKNKEVETALNDQLVPYLIDQRYKHGIYLIGWHYGEHDSKPSRVKSLPVLHDLLKRQTQAVDPRYSIRTLLLDIRLPADNLRSDEDEYLFEAI